MGLPYAHEYSCRAHFKERAMERFGVDEDQLRRWVNQHVPSLHHFDSSFDQRPDTEAYVAEDGVVFVCDLKNREFITCFQAVNLTVDEEQKEVCQDIHRENVLAYKHSQSKLLNRYRLKEAKELLANIDEHVDRFYSLSQTLKKGALSDRNYHHLEELLNEFHVIKAAIRVIENKKNDYHTD